MSHFPKKTVISLGLLTCFLALPIFGIPWALKAYLFFFLGAGVTGFTYVATLPRKRREVIRKGKGVVIFPEMTSQIVPEAREMPSHPPVFSESEVRKEAAGPSSSPSHQKNSLHAHTTPRVSYTRSFPSIQHEVHRGSVRRSVKKSSEKHLEKERRTVEK